MEFGLNVWNRNHFSPLRKAQWPWEEVLLYCDWVKPIAYQHQAGTIYKKEINFWKSNFLEYDNNKTLSFFNEVLNITTVNWDKLIESGLDPSDYVYNQCKETVESELIRKNLQLI